MTDERFILGTNVLNPSVWRRAYEYAARVVHLGSLEIVIRLVRDTRSLKQNKRMWAMLTDISRQIPWVVNDRVVMMTPEDWKDLLSASLTHELRVARGIDGGMVLLGVRTSRMTVAQMSNLIELMFAFGNPRGVKWSDPTATPEPADMPEEWREAA